MKQQGPASCPRMAIVTHFTNRCSETWQHPQPTLHALTDILQNTQWGVKINFPKLASLDQIRNHQQVNRKFFNPLTPFHWNFNSILRIDHQKNFLWPSCLWVGRRKEPILGYVKALPFVEDQNFRSSCSNSHYFSNYIVS